MFVVRQRTVLGIDGLVPPYEVRRGGATQQTAANRHGSLCAPVAADAEQVSQCKKRDSQSPYFAGGTDIIGCLDATFYVYLSLWAATAIQRIPNHKAEPHGRME